MKKNLFLIFTFLMSITYGNANKINFFKYDKEELSKEFVTLDVIENYVKNYNLTYSELAKKEKDLAFFLNFNDVYNLSLAQSEPPLGIPSFWWGCFFGVSGILVVYLITEDKAEVMKAFKGCLISAFVIMCIYVIYIAIILTYTTTVSI